jgi:arginine exporter protein ArgO
LASLRWFGHPIAKKKKNLIGFDPWRWLNPKEILDGLVLEGGRRKKKYAREEKKKR